VGLKLLTRTHLSVERVDKKDPFACAWFVAEVAGLEGLWRPDLGRAFVERASKRCPAEPRLQLAFGVLLEQAAAQEPGSVTQSRIVDAYRAVDPASSARAEAMVRSAWLACQSGDADGAGRLLPADVTAGDPYVRFIFSLVAGHVRRAQGQLDAAESAYREALREVPTAQSARVALMTLLLLRGESAEAGFLARAVQTASPDEVDPWRDYWAGDSRSYPALIAHLRELGR